MDSRSLKPISSSAVRESFSARARLGTWASTSPIRCAIANCLNSSGGKPLRWLTIPPSGRPWRTPCVRFPANGSSGIISPASAKRAEIRQLISVFMRVIAGTYRSRVLRSLKGPALRPTSDRLRETLFNVLGSDVAGARFVDLFAGTGAVGIEALSRGAVEVVFIENHAPAVTLIRRNLESLGVNSGATVLAVDALRGLALLASQKRPSATGYNFIFVDPPYAAAEDYSRVLEFLRSTELLAPGGIVIAEHRRNFDLPEELGVLKRFRVLKQGDAALSFYRRQPL